MFQRQQGVCLEAPKSEKRLTDEKGNTGQVMRITTTPRQKKRSMPVLALTIRRRSGFGMSSCATRNTRPPTETLLKTEKTTLVLEGIGDGKIRCSASSW